MVTDYVSVISISKGTQYLYIFLVIVDYQSSKLARRVGRKSQDEHEKIRHPSDASHCSSDKSVGEVDAAESLIVLSSTTSQKETSQKGHRAIKMEEDEQLKPYSNASEENISMKISQDTNIMTCRTNGHPNMASRTLRVNGNPMDLSPANLSTSTMFKMQGISQSPSSFPNSPKVNFTSTQSGSNYPSSLSTTSQCLQQPHRQVMTVTPLVDHVALVNTVLNAPSMPTMVIPMDDLDHHKIHHVNPNNLVFSKNNMLNGKLVSDER